MVYGSKPILANTGSKNITFFAHRVRDELRLKPADGRCPTLHILIDIPCSTDYTKSQAQSLVTG